MTPNLAFRRETFDRIGLFDTRFPGGGWEDADLCWRLRGETSLDIAYAPHAVVFHRYRATARDFLAQHFRYGYGLGLIRRKYGDDFAPEADWASTRRVARELAAVSWSLLTGIARFGSGRGDRAAVAFCYFDLLRQIGQRCGFARAALSRERH